MLIKLINKIYIINLKSCTDRKEHIIQELHSVNINDYEIFEAIDKDSDQVKNIMNTDYIRKFPPCFRCNKNKCNCSNNILIKQQIGNWFSFINVMKDIIQNDYKDLIMICEDDIKFTDNGIDILTKMITNENLENYKIDFQKPILIRVGSGFNLDHTLNHEPKLVKKIVMSNPCFIINTKFAHSFINNLNEINTTSDVYIHDKILSKDKSIQSYTVLPQPIYELSTGKFKKFKSEIHPKGFDVQDKLKQQNHFMRIEYRKFLCIGHPLCGTKNISEYLKQMGYNVGHENMNEDGVSSWMLCVEDDKYPWGDVKDKFRYYFENIIQVVRNPFDAIPSIILENKYSPNNASYIFRKKHIKYLLDIDLPDINIDIDIDVITEIEIAIKTFIYWYKICEKLNPRTICKIEEISNLQKFNTNNITINICKKNSDKKYCGKNYNKPLITNDMYEKIDNNLKKELEQFCKKYNYKNIIESDIIHNL